MFLGRTIFLDKQGLNMAELHFYWFLKKSVERIEPTIEPNQNRPPLPQTDDDDLMTWMRLSGRAESAAMKHTMSSPSFWSTSGQVVNGLQDSCEEFSCCLTPRGEFSALLSKQLFFKQIKCKYNLYYSIILPGPSK